MKRTVRWDVPGDVHGGILIRNIEYNADVTEEDTVLAKSTSGYVIPVSHADFTVVYGPGWFHLANAEAQGVTQ
jgi:hypothetical protein